VSQLKGADELRARLKAIQGVFRQTAPRWQRATVAEARRRVPVATGATRASLRAGPATSMKASVVGKYTVNFIDAGSVAHNEPRSRRRKGRKVLKFNVGGQTIFRRKVHKRAIAARPFKEASAEAGMRKVDLLRVLIDLWNKAA